MIPEIVLIAAMDANRGIGKDGGMPWHIPSDLRNFRSLTLGHPVIMGRNTFQSLGYKPLYGRLNIVVSKSESRIPYPGVLSAVSLVDAITLLDDSGMFDKVFIIGGGQVYKEALEEGIPNTLILTTLSESYDCDVFFPEVPEGYLEYAPVTYSVEGEPTYTVTNWIQSDD